MSTTTKEKKPAAKEAAATPTAEESANAFAITLAQLGKGNNLAELSSELNRLVRAVRATGKKGKLAYTLHVVPVDGTDGAQVVLTDEIKLNTPSPDRKSSLFFTTDDGQLTRRDPNQRDWIEEQEALARQAAAQAPQKHDAISLQEMKASAVASSK